MYLYLALHLKIMSRGQPCFFFTMIISVLYNHITGRPEPHPRDILPVRNNLKNFEPRLKAPLPPPPRITCVPSGTPC